MQCIHATLVKRVSYREAIAFFKIRRGVEDAVTGNDNFMIPRQFFCCQDAFQTCSWSTLLKARFNRLRQLSLCVGIRSLCDSVGFCVGSKTIYSP